MSWTGSFSLCGRFVRLIYHLAWLAAGCRLLSMLETMRSIQGKFCFFLTHWQLHLYASPLIYTTGDPSNMPKARSKITSFGQLVRQTQFQKTACKNGIYYLGIPGDFCENQSKRQKFEVLRLAFRFCTFNSTRDGPGRGSESELIRASEHKAESMHVCVDCTKKS